MSVWPLHLGYHVSLQLWFACLRPLTIINIILFLITVLKRRSLTLPCPLINSGKLVQSCTTDTLDAGDQPVAELPHPPALLLLHPSPPPLQPWPGCKLYLSPCSVALSPSHPSTRKVTKNQAQPDGYPTWLCCAWSACQHGGHLHLQPPYHSPVSRVLYPSNTTGSTSWCSLVITEARKKCIRVITMEPKALELAPIQLGLRALISLRRLPHS